MPSDKQFGIGSTVWVFDCNHRVYRKDGKGNSVGSPIHREHWRPYVIDSETKQSWIISFARKPWRKFPKRDVAKPFGRGRDYRMWAISEEEVDLDCWQHDHRYKVVNLVESCDIPTLRKVAELVGYKESPHAD